jgi:serine protein kinase
MGTMGSLDPVGREPTPRDERAMSSAEGRSNLCEWLRELAQSEAAPCPWVGTFAEYLPMVEARPELAESAHSRLYRMIRLAGVEERGGRRHYRFFDGELFGLDAALEHLVEDYLHAAALGMEVRKRLVLLMGPVSGGKSTLVWLLKRGLEAFTRTEAGQVYGIQGCPMQEDPLHLVPEALRPDVERRLNISIAGDLCPWCRYRLDHEFQGRFLEVPVERVYFSESRRVGIGTFVPSDPKSQDIADLTGSVDFSTITEYGSEADPRAFRFDGELYRANRGLMEFQEMLKLDEKFLYHLLGLTQEGRFKAGRFALIAADEMVVGHTNEAEFRAFQANPKNEALLSRMLVIRVPYPLAVADEVRIYRKLLASSRVAEGVHWAPGALEAAAVVSVASRLGETTRPGVDMLVKLAVLNGEPVPGLVPEDREAIWREARRDGMSGLDPRYVVNRIASAVIARRADCLNALDILRAIRDGVESSALVDRGQAEKLEEWVQVARRHYDGTMRRVVERAFLTSFEEQARALFDNYLANVEASLNATRRDPLTGQVLGGDEDLMRAVEEPLGIGENQRRAFREEVWLRVSAAGSHRAAWDYRVHPRLREAVEAKVFQDLRDVVKISLPGGRPDPEQETKVEAVTERLLDEGFCPRCARETVLYVGGLLAR